MTTEMFLNKDVSKTDEALHDECFFLMQKIKYEVCLVAFSFNCVIGLKKKM
jgi:hypothetical protein